MKPVAAAVSRALHSKGRAPLIAATLLTSSAALAQGSASLEEIVVTASKRTENLQDVPIAVTAFDNTKMRQLGMENFADFAMMVPNLSFKTSAYQGPSMIMRGASDGGDGNPSGQAPSVAVYLDEQPVSFVGGQLDIHIYDMERIEALAGPQGTLFGAISQTGTVRYITNKPDNEAFDAGFDLQALGTQDGDPGGSAEGFVNFPIGENGALRLVGWYLEEGGWIDNVPESAAFGVGRRRPGGPVQLNPGSYTYPLYDGVTAFLGATTRNSIKTNDAFVEDDINELTKVGARLALGINLTENWTLTLGANYQDTETDGVWEHAPDQVGDGNIQRYSEDSWDDEWIQYSLTVEGEFLNHELVYAGAFMDRDTEYNMGYNAYGEYNSYVNYYGCDYTASAPLAPTVPPTVVNTDCVGLEEQAIFPNNIKRTSHELRVLSLADSRLHYTVGLFTEKIEFNYNLNFVQPNMSEANWVLGIEDLYFRTWHDRENTQFAVFGEVSFDITDSVTILGGMRWFDEEETMTGVVGFDGNAFVPAPGKDTFIDSKYTNDDQIFKLNVTWRVNDDALLYATWSEGYRPGGVNREANFVGTTLETYIPDIMQNYEIGWKTTWLDGALRFNGATYFMEWDDIQFTIYDFGLSVCCGNTYNLSTAEIVGAEFDLSWRITDAWTVSLAGAYNDAETTGDFFLPMQPAGDPPEVPDGTKLPNVPEFQGNAVIRYDFNLTSTLPGYAQLVWAYTDSSTSEIRPVDTFPQDSYNIGNFRTGVSAGRWGVDLFVDNLTDERADIYVHPRNYEMTTVTNRPRSYGVRYWMRFE